MINKNADKKGVTRKQKEDKGKRRETTRTQ